MSQIVFKPLTSLRFRVCSAVERGLEVNFPVVMFISKAAAFLCNRLRDFFSITTLCCLYSST